MAEQFEVRAESTSPENLGIVPRAITGSLIFMVADLDCFLMFMVFVSLHETQLHFK